MKTSATTSPNAPFNAIWSYIDRLSDTAKLELIGELSNSLLHTSTYSNSADKRRKFLSLAGTWNADARAASMDEAALSARKQEICRNFNFND